MGASVDLALVLRKILGDSTGASKALVRVRPVDLSTRMVRTSTFDLTTFDPDLSYQLALGGLNDFLTQNSTMSLGASEGRTATIAGGADLPYGFSLALSHSLIRTTQFHRVNAQFVQTESKQQEWPTGTARWSQTLQGGPLALVAVGTSFRRRKGSSVQANRDGAPAETGIESSSISPNLQLTLRNGLSFSAALNALSQQNASNGHQTHLDQHDLTGSFNYTFRLPRALSHLRKPARSSLTLLSTETRSCLQQTDQPDCVSISDVSRREIRGGLDADFVQALTGGLQFSYSINDAKHLNRRTSQISIIASFELSLFAGDYR
jgi:hypothetical protein